MENIKVDEMEDYQEDLMGMWVKNSGGIAESSQWS